MPNSRKPKNFSWIDEGKLAAFGCPSTLENIRYLLENNINCVVTLSPETSPPVHLLAEINWVEIKVREFHPPNNCQIEMFIDVCEKAINEKKAVGVHCRMGRGRTGVMAACYLIRFKNMKPVNAIEWVRNSRPGSIETYSQEEAVMDYFWSLCKRSQNAKN